MLCLGLGFFLKIVVLLRETTSLSILGYFGGIISRGMSFSCLGPFVRCCSGFRHHLRSSSSFFHFPCTARGMSEGESMRATGVRMEGWGVHADRQWGVVTERAGVGLTRLGMCVFLLSS